MSIQPSRLVERLGGLFGSLGSFSFRFSLKISRRDFLKHPSFKSQHHPSTSQHHLTSVLVCYINCCFVIRIFQPWAVHLRLQTLWNIHKNPYHSKGPSPASALNWIRVWQTSPLSTLEGIKSTEIFTALEAGSACRWPSLEAKWRALQPSSSTLTIQNCFKESQNSTIFGFFLKKWPWKRRKSTTRNVSKSKGPCCIDLSSGWYQPSDTIRRAWKNGPK